MTVRDLLSAITVAGFLGDVFIRRLTAVDLDEPFHGAIVVYTDDGWNHGAYLVSGPDGSLYSTRSLSIRDITVDLPFADRKHVGISGVEFVRIGGFSIAASRTAIALDSYYDEARLNDTLCVIDGEVTRSSATINNSIVEFLVPGHLSQYQGFGALNKIDDGWYWENGPRANHLTDAEIDSLWPRMPTPSTGGGP